MIDKEVFINGILHNYFTQSTYSPDSNLLNSFREFFPKSFFQIAAFSLSRKYQADSYQHQIVSAIPKYATENASIPIWFYKTENNEYLLIMNYDKDDDTYHFIEDVYKYFSERYNCPTFWGISRPCFSLSELIFAKKEALTSLHFCLQNNAPDITQYNAALTFQSERSFEYFYPETVKQLFIKGIKNSDYPLIDLLVTVLYDENVRILSINPEAFIQLNNELVNTLKMFNSSKYHFSDELLQLNSDIIIHQNHPEKYFDLLTDVCHIISEQLNGQKLSRKNAFIFEVQQFINENYPDANLNLSGVALHFHLSEGYLSVLFKETAGVSFAEYLEKCRIDKSCTLLCSSNQSINAISQAVGYNSVYSFRRAFKRILGASPKEYRERHE